MIPLADGAERQLCALLEHYAELGRPEAGRRLIEAVDRAIEEIECGRADALPAPRPYPGLARLGRLWTKSGRYWIAYGVSPLVILAVFYETANIPARFE